MKKIFLFLLLVKVSFFMVAGSISVTAAEQKNSDRYAEYEIMYWQSVKDSENIDMLRAYMIKYPNGVFVDLAKIKIKALEKESTDSASEKINDRSNSNTLTKIQLRSTPKKLEEDEINQIVHKYKFCDLNRNEAGDFVNILKDNQDGTITDEATGLVWEKVGSWRKQSRKNANWYIDDLNYRKFAGRTNWRLPTVEELVSLIECRYSERDWLYIDTIFGDPRGDWIDTCWSADTLRPERGADEAAWVVNFKYGSIMPAIWVNTLVLGFNPEHEYNYVRAVSSATE